MPAAQPPPEPNSKPRPERIRNPWWIPPFLGRIPPGVEPSHLRIMGFVALAMFFENFDMSLLGAVLKFLAEDFGLDKAELGSFTGAIRLGTLPAFLIIPFADRLGRRRMFLISVVGLSAGTFLTAFSQTPAQFIACQVLSRSFIITASAIAFVIITEEFPAAHRGWGLGMLGAVAAIGHGFGALLFGFIDYLPYGWRSLYVVGVIPILFVPFLGRGIQETSRFARFAAGESSAGRSGGVVFRSIEPLIDLGRHHPWQALGVLVLGVLGTAGTAVGFQFIGEYVLTVHGWSPAQYSAMFILCGAVGIIGSPWAGRLGDTYGRRRVAAITLAIFPLWAIAFYSGPGWLLPFCWVGMVFTSMSSSVVIRAITNETFPTSRRGTAGGVLSLMETAGASLGLFLYAGMMITLPEQGTIVSIVSILTAISIIALPLFPETRALELESISSDSGERPARGEAREEGRKDDGPAAEVGG
jgi:MFS family permease